MNYIRVLFLLSVCVLTHVTHAMPTLAEAKAARKASKAKVTWLNNKIFSLSQRTTSCLKFQLWYHR